MLLPAPKNGFEPDWLLKLTPTSDKQNVYRVNTSPVTDVLVTQRNWTLEEPWSQTVRRMDRYCLAANGWTKDDFPKMSRVTWQKMESGEGFTVFVFKLEQHTQVQTHSSRPLSWLESTQRSLRKFFGVQEK